MEFLETSLFTKQLNALFTDDEYQKIQEYMIKTPDVGDIIQGGGGIRKLRWSLDNRGKSGGVRIIYYWETPNDVLFMLFMYSKNKAENLTKAQLKFLKNIVIEEFKD